jgi:hypothetical protein
MEEKPPKVLEDPDYLIRNLRDFITRCTNLLTNDQPADLSGMNNQVEELCGIIRVMPLKEAQRLNPKLETLIAELTALGHLVEEKKDSIGVELKGLNKQQQAVTAYQRAGGGQPPQPQRDGEDA